jgi:hypothetical protein
MERVTAKQLDQMAEVINNQLGVTATEAWTRQKDGTYKANIGYHHVMSSGYGSSLVRLCSEGGGVSDILRANTKRELMQQMRAFSYGLAARNEG